MRRQGHACRSTGVPCARKHPNTCYGSVVRPPIGFGGMHPRPDQDEQAEAAPSLHCRFLSEMIAILAKTPSSVVLAPDDARFMLLLELEERAEIEGAPEGSCEVIRRVRIMAGFYACQVDRILSKDSGAMFNR